MQLKIPLIFDHDLGTNPDDFFALQMLLHYPEIDIKMLISGNCFPEERARFARKILDLNGCYDIPSFAGEQAGCVEFFAEQFIDGSEKIENNYLQAIKDILDNNERVVYLAIEGLSNLEKFIRQYPEYQEKLMVVHMGLTLTGYEEGYMSGGTNMEANALAAKYVYENVESLNVVGSHTTINHGLRVHPDTGIYKKLEKSSHLAHKLLFSHLHEFYNRRGIWPALHDPLTASVALGLDFVAFIQTDIDFDAQGKYTKGTQTKINISQKECKADGFMAFCEKYV